MFTETVLKLMNNIGVVMVVVSLVGAIIVSKFVKDEK
jgi:hypothetical protein